MCSSKLAHCSFPSKTLKRILVLISEKQAISCGGVDCYVPRERIVLHYIDSVQKIVIKELQGLQKTPSAIAAERRRKIRNLMSMR